MPLTYYGPGSGAGIAFSHARKLFGPTPAIGVVGLGTGTLACFAQPGETWRFYEIDPAVLELSRNATFTFVRDCAPHAEVVIGDARIELAKVRPGSIDLLAIDAFSSDAIPLHLLTDEAFGVYLQALSPRGILLVHISNRYIELEPALAAIVRARALHAALRDDEPPEGTELTGSSWVAISRDRDQLGALGGVAPAMPWTALKPPAPNVWSDDHASILPFIRWYNFLGSPS
jgi:SAM-dependent methyltransferase